MNFILSVEQKNSFGIFGHMSDEKGENTFMTLQHSYEESPDVFVAKIPLGVYKCTRFMSPHFGYEVFMLNDVPGHDHILIHKGNINANSTGCILIGMDLVKQNGAFFSISKSEVAFDKFMALQEGIDSFMLTVQDYK